jgi:hypothetical protein
MSMAQFIQKLRDLGYTGMYFEYNGAGDSGAYGDNVTYWTGPEVEYWVVRREDQINKPDEISDTEQTDFLNDVYDAYMPGGWEINEGSCGHFTVNVVEGNIIHEHTLRVEETSSEIHEILEPLAGDAPQADEDDVQFVPWGVPAETRPERPTECKEPEDVDDGRP